VWLGRANVGPRPMAVDDSSPRVRQLQGELLRLGLAGAVLRLPENVLLMTGYLAQIPGMALMMVPVSGEGVLFVPEYEIDEVAAVWGGQVEGFDVIRNDRPAPAVAIERLVADFGRRLELTGGRIGLELGFETVAPPSMAGEPAAVAEPTRSLCKRAMNLDHDAQDLTEALEAIRAVKTARELERIRLVNEVAGAGLDAFKLAARPGRSEVDVMADVERAVMVAGHGYRGVRTARAWATVYSGPDLASGWRYFRSRTRQIEPNDVVMLEIGTSVDGYWADHTRTVVAGRATALQRKAFEAVRSAVASALAAAVPGATGASVDAAARTACEASGFEQFPHHTGHGVGFRYHESRPQLTPGSTDKLVAGNVIAVEPGIYSDELSGGFRHEDDAVITASGAQLLGGTDFDLDM
jgi:Xaa-Pro aminopeptidase